MSLESLATQIEADFDRLAEYAVRCYVMADE